MSIAVSSDIVAENKFRTSWRSLALAFASVSALLSGCSEPPVPEPIAAATYECSDNTSVCDIGNARERCGYFDKFNQGGEGLVSGFVSQQICCENATTTEEKNSCFEYDKNLENFKGYAQSYCEGSGFHSAFTWSTPKTYSKQPNHSMIADYYGGYIGANKYEFNLTLKWESMDAEFAVKTNACAGGTEWKYWLFGFASDTIDYGIGFDVLSPKTGCIVRQTATAQAPPQVNAPGFDANPPTSVPDDGNVGRAYNKYLKAFQNGCAECIASLYEANAKIFFYSSRGDTDWNKYYPDFKVFTGEDIEAYYRKLFASLGADYDVSPQVQDCAESNLEIDVPPFCYVAYEIRTNLNGEDAVARYATSLIFTENGKIYGEGVVNEMKGLGDRIQAPSTPSFFNESCGPSGDF